MAAVAAGCDQGSAICNLQAMPVPLIHTSYVGFPGLRLKPEFRVSPMKWFQLQELPSG